jgi:hypothetical protein
MRDIIQTVRAAAQFEARSSALPGLAEGPADALRHIIGAAELRRRVGLAAAFAAVEGNELLAVTDGGTRASVVMDRKNNFIGLEIGADAEIFDEVVERARAAIQAGIEAGGNRA